MGAIKKGRGNKENSVTGIRKKQKKLSPNERKQEKEKRRQRRARVIIRNISYKATEDNLRKHFEQFGNIQELNLLKRPDGKLVGCAFIQYETVNQAAKAILKATNKEFLGRPVFLDWAVGKDEYEKKANGNKLERSGEIKEEEDDSSTCEAEENVEIKEESDDSSENDLYHKESESGESDTEVSEDGDNELNESDEKLELKTKIKEEPNQKKSKRISNDVKEGCTVFIKNIPFDATNDDLRRICRKFGPVYYALINIEPVSGHSKGTGFVKFKSKESADLCLKSGVEFKLQDNILEPFPALNREEIRNKANVAKKETTDSRNLYLAKEGLIMAGSKAAEGVSASDMAKRHKLERIKTQILKNLNRFVSRNRLSIHNLPLNYDNEKLRKMVEKYTNLKPHECRVMRENKPTLEHPQGKSKGFGFMSFKKHEDALTALRKLNNNPSVFGPANRPIVAFSIEDRSVHNIKQKRLKKSKENNPTYKAKIEKRRARKEQKKLNQKDDKVSIQKKLKKSVSSRKGDSIDVAEVGDFAGLHTEPGAFVRMRSFKKIQEQSKEHLKKLKEIKKKEKRKKEQLMIKNEKKEIDRPRQGKQKSEKDNFSFLVDKYKRLIDSAAESGDNKNKRRKWYVE